MHKYVQTIVVGLNYYCMNFDIELVTKGIMCPMQANSK